MQCFVSIDCRVKNQVISVWVLTFDWLSFPVWTNLRVKPQRIRAESGKVFILWAFYAMSWVFSQFILVNFLSRGDGDLLIYNMDVFSSLSEMDLGSMKILKKESDMYSISSLAGPHSIRGLTEGSGRLISKWMNLNQTVEPFICLQLLLQLQWWRRIWPQSPQKSDFPAESEAAPSFWI